MSKIWANKCEVCGGLFEDDYEYNKHVRVHELLKNLEEEFPRGDFNRSNFIQRDKEWLERYKKAVQEIIGRTGFPPFTGGWYRCLKNSGNQFCDIAYRILNVCETCFKEWARQADVAMCSHS